MQAASIAENYTDGLDPDEIAAVFELPIESVRALLSYVVDRNPALKP